MKKLILLFGLIMGLTVNAQQNNSRLDDTWHLDKDEYGNSLHSILVTKSTLMMDNGFSPNANFQALIFIMDEEISVQLFYKNKEFFVTDKTTDKKKISLKIKNGENLFFNYTIKDNLLYIRSYNDNDDNLVNILTKGSGEEVSLGMMFFLNDNTTSDGLLFKFKTEISN